VTSRKRWLVGFLILTASFVLIATAYPVRWVRHIDNDTQVLSNDSEAYFFINSSRLGYQFNLLQFAVYRLAAPFGITPTESRRDLVVVRVTATDVEQTIFRARAWPSAGSK
jgi:hypothetical protein